MKSTTLLFEKEMLSASFRRCSLIREEATLSPDVNLSRENHYWLSTGGNTARIWRNSDCVVLGRFLKPEDEVWMEEADALGVPVLKRPSGGGAVFHDLGNINYSLYLDGSLFAGLHVEETLQLLSYPVTGFLERLGVPWTWVPPNNIYVEGRKVSGSAQARHKNRLLHHGTLLVNCDLEKMNCLLKPGGRSKTAPTINLKELIGGISVESVEKQITEVLSGRLPPGQRVQPSAKCHVVAVRVDPVESCPPAQELW